MPVIPCPICEKTDCVKMEQSYCSRCEESFSEFERLLSVVDQAVRNLDFKKREIKGLSAVGLLKTALNYYNNLGMHYPVSLVEIDKANKIFDTPVLVRLKWGEFAIGKFDSKSLGLSVDSKEISSYQDSEIEKIYHLPEGC